MAGESYGPVVPPSGATFIAGHTMRASQIERCRQNFVIAGKRRYIDLGGSDSIGTESTSYERAVQAPEVELCEEDFRGLTVDLVVWVRVASGGTVRMRLYNTDDASAIAEMTSAVSNTTLTRYIVTVTLPSGTTHKWCQLEIKTSSADFPAYGFGRLRIRL